MSCCFPVGLDVKRQIAHDLWRLACRHGQLAQYSRLRKAKVMGKHSGYEPREKCRLMYLKPPHLRKLIHWCGEYLGSLEVR